MNPNGCDEDKLNESENEACSELESIHYA